MFLTRPIHTRGCRQVYYCHPYGQFFFLHSSSMLAVIELSSLRTMFFSLVLCSINPSTIPCMYHLHPNKCLTHWLPTSLSLAAACHPIGRSTELLLPFQWTIHQLPNNDRTFESRWPIPHILLFFLLYFLFSRTMLGGGAVQFFGAVCFANPFGFKAASIQCNLCFFWRAVLYGHLLQNMLCPVLRGCKLDRATGSKGGCILLRRDALD